MTTDFVHETLTFERRLAHAPSAVFASYADVEQRAVWSAPSTDETVVFDDHDFRVGGVDYFVCGLEGDPSFVGTTRYERIVDDESIVFTERLTTTDGHLLAMSLVTWAVTSDGNGGTRLVITDQVTSVVGNGPIEGSTHGYAAMLDLLEKYLATRP